MLKFRVTNSMRARRAAEAQRKALEEKLQLEWAWKPMAAMMNEKQTDLVYWIPPLYRNNIKQAGARVRKKFSHRTSINRRSINRSINSSNYQQLQAAHMYTQLHASQRKKKLARTRHKLHTEVSFENATDTESIVRPRRKSRVAREISVGSLEDPTDTDSISRVRRRSKVGQRVSFENATDTDSAVLDSTSEWQDAKDADIESGIHDETTDYNADDMSLLNVQSIHEEVVQPTGTTMKRRLGEHRRVHQSAMKPKVPPKPDFITKSFEAIDKPKPALTLIRLLEKVSHIHCPSVKSIKPIKPELRKINRRGSESKSSTKGKIKRPSVKIYGGNPQNRLSVKRSKGLDDENDLGNQCVIVSVDNETLKAVPKAVPVASPKASPKSSTKPSKSASKSSSKSGSKSTPKCLSKASLKSLPKDLQKEIPKVIPKTPLKDPKEYPYSILKDPQNFGILKDNLVKPDEAESRNAQLQMILRLLAQLYEEKVSRQDSEIQNMKSRIQTQDTLMKQMAHVVLELKEEISRIKLQVTGASRPDIPANVLNIKVGNN